MNIITVLVRLAITAVSVILAVILISPNGVRPSVRRPVLPTCKTRIALTATIFNLFKANTKKITNEVARPQAATFVLAFDRVNIVAINAILDSHIGKTGRRTVGRTPFGLQVPSWCETTMDDQNKTELHY